MTEKENISNETALISKRVADLSRVNVFSAPANYFEHFYEELAVRLGAERFSRDISQTVPEGYFENLAGSVMQKILGELSVSEETASVSKLVASAGNKNVFSVPQGYFAEEVKIPAENVQAKVVQMNPFRKIYKLAAAAVITGLLGLGVMKIVNSDQPKPDQPVQMASVLKTADDIIKTGSFDKELNNLADNDIENYLTENGQDVNAALVASATDDDNNLPEADDYLLDENALNDFLQKQNLSN